MRRTVSAAVIEGGKLLLVSESDKIWTLPGGKVESCEMNLDCLVREIQEELACRVAQMPRMYFGSFKGISPRSKTPTETVVYRVVLEGEPTPSAEIAHLCWTEKPEDLNLSGLTAKVVAELRRRKVLI